MQVTTWILCDFQRFAVLCCQITLFILQKYDYFSTKQFTALNYLPICTVKTNMKKAHQICHKTILYK